MTRQFEQYSAYTPMPTTTTASTMTDNRTTEKLRKLLDEGDRMTKKTCEVECFDDGIDEGMDGEWYSYAPPTWYLSCGHEAYGSECPKFCPECGARIEVGE